MQSFNYLIKLFLYRDRGADLVSVLGYSVRRDEEDLAFCEGGGLDDTLLKGGGGGPLFSILTMLKI